MIRLSAAVMAHPRRLPAATALRDRHPELNLRVVVDPRPDGPPSSVRTAQVAWGTVSADATHHLVLQDDAVLCESFLSRVSSAVAALPGDALSLFTEWGSDTSYAVRLAALTGANWAEVVDHYVPSVALVLPAAVAREFAQWPVGAPQDDVELHAFLRARRIRAVVPVPNLVDHDPGASLVGNDIMGDRRSACFVAAPSPGPAAATVLTPDVLPVVSSLDRGLPRCLVRDPESGTWLRTDPLHLARLHRMDVPRLLADGAAAVASHVEGQSEMYRFAVTGLWLTGFGLGLQAAALGPASSTGTADEDVVRRAMDTMPAGAFRGYLRPDLPSFDADMVTLIRSGIRSGADHPLRIA